MGYSMRRNDTMAHSVYYKGTCWHVRAQNVNGSRAHTNPPAFRMGCGVFLAAAVDVLFTPSVRFS